MEQHSWPLEPVVLVYGRTPGGAPVAGALVATQYRMEDGKPKITGSLLRINRVNEPPQFVVATASQVHLPGQWTWRRDAYPEAPEWPPRGVQVPIPTARAERRKSAPPPPMLPPRESEGRPSDSPAAGTPVLCPTCGNKLGTKLGP